MALHGLDKRFAYAIMSLKFVGDSTWRILGGILIWIGLRITLLITRLA